MIAASGLSRYFNSNGTELLSFDRFSMWAVAIVTLAMALRTYALIADPHAPLSGSSRHEASYQSTPHPTAECQEGTLTC